MNASVLVFSVDTLYLHVRTHDAAGYVISRQICEAKIISTCILPVEGTSKYITIGVVCVSNRISYTYIHVRYVLTPTGPPQYPVHPH